MPLSVTLPPGDYALIFGSGQFGATATTGVMTLSNIDTGQASYFFWNGASWVDADLRRTRFVVEGKIVTNTDSDGDGVLDADDLCPGTAMGDSVDADGCSDAQRDDDSDGVSNADDLCPGTATGDPVDGDGCSDDQLDLDNDGVLGADDNCPDTIIPESLPTRSLGVNRFALVDNMDNVFDTTSPKGKGPRRSYTTDDTTGCSCTQIIEAEGLGNGHTKFGCSISAMDDWVRLVTP